MFAYVALKKNKEFSQEDASVGYIDNIDDSEEALQDLEFSKKAVEQSSIALQSDLNNERSLNY